MLFYIVFDQYDYKLFKVNDIKDCLLNIMQIILLKQDGFLSMSLLKTSNENETEHSIIIRNDLCKDIISTASCQDLYKLVKIEAYSTYDGGLNEFGVLSEITKKFARYEIPILCLSSFSNNYILYPIQYNEKVKDFVENSGDFTL